MIGGKRVICATIKIPMASCSKNICGGQHKVFFGSHPNLLVSDNNNGITNKLMTKMTKTKMRC
jgi:hypothetical protein